MKFYGLKHTVTGELMGIDVRGCPGEFTVDIEYILDLLKYTSFLYSTQSKEAAEKVCVSTADIYDSTSEFPINEYVGKLEVVEFAFQP